MVTLAYVVSHIAAVVVRIDISYEALLSAAAGALEFLLSAPRHFRGFQLVSVISIHCLDFCLLMCSVSGIFVICDCT